LSFQQFIFRWLTSQVLQKAKSELLKTLPKHSGLSPTHSESLSNDSELPPTHSEFLSNDLSVSKQLCCVNPLERFSKESDKLEQTGVDIGFVFAMPMEAAGVADVLKQPQTTKGNGRIFHTGIFHHYRVALVESGVGQENAGRAADVLIDVFRPKRLISAGYAGGLAKRLKQFNVCFPEVLIRESDGKTLYVSNSIPENIGFLPNFKESSTNSDGISSGSAKLNGKLRLLTTDYVVDSPDQKLLLNCRTGAELVDMETFAVAEVCQKCRIPMQAVRIILDTADEHIPKDIQRILKNVKKGNARLIGSVLGSVCSRPSSIVDLFSLRQRALLATDKLAKHIAIELGNENKG
jgi:adenosylhomocysteine nucleosidase